MKNSKILARCAILCATVIWGSSFAILKNTLDSLPILFILAVRFLGAGVILAVAFPKKLRGLDTKTVLYGAGVGLCLFLAYYTQTIGLAHTTPGKNAFLTAVYCILVPFLYWIFYKVKPDKFNISAAVICLTGIGFVSLDANLTLSFGDLMTLVSGFFWAGHILLISGQKHEHDAITMTILQFLFCGLFALIGTLASEKVEVAMVQNAWIELIYLTVFCTTVTLLFQNWGQKILPPSSAAILLSFEAVFGVIFSILLTPEMPTVKMFIGFLLIFISTIISETKLDFMKKK